MILINFLVDTVKNLGVWLFLILPVGILSVGISMRKNNQPDGKKKLADQSFGLILIAIGIFGIIFVMFISYAFWSTFGRGALLK